MSRIDATCQQLALEVTTPALRERRHFFPKLTWNPSTPSAARFDNCTVNDGYTDAGF